MWEVHVKKLKSCAVCLICGVKNSGKTTLIEKLIREFSRRGMTIAVIKHDGHDFTCDLPGTDSSRFTQAGACGTAVFSEKRIFIHRLQPEPQENEDGFADPCAGMRQWEQEQVKELMTLFPDADIILIEGLKNTALPKIEVVRSMISSEPVSVSEGRFGIVTDLSDTAFPGEKVFPFTAIREIADAIVEQTLSLRKTDKERIRNDFAAAILAGGKSRRMNGQHKGALLTSEGRTFTEQITSQMFSLSDCIYLSYGDTICIEIDGCRIVTDRYPGCGPIGGLEAVLSQAGEDRRKAVMISACDTPGIKAELYLFLLERLEQVSTEDAFEEWDGVVAVSDDRIHPLTAIYSVRAAEIFAKQIKERNFRLRDVLRKLRILYVDLKGSRYEDMLTNINTKEEYEAHMRG